METETEAEIKSFLNYIRGIGIKAWIPGSPGSGPKMSVDDQCLSGIFCLNQKGLEIYIQGISRREKDNKSSREFVDNLDHVKSAQLKDELYRFDRGPGNTAVRNDNLGVNNITSHVDAVKLMRDVGIQWSDNDIIGDSLEMPKSSKSDSCSLEKSVGTRCGGVEQKTFVREITGVEFKRIVKEKLTREVRVAKCYVSSLPNRKLNSATVINCHLDKKALRSDYTGKLWSSLDDKGLTEIEKSGLSPGFVRKLINHFDVYDNVEQQCPRHHKTF